MTASFRNTLYLFALSFVTLCASGVLAQNAGTSGQQPDITKSPYREIWEKSQQFNPKPSMDETPVRIEKAGTQYLIPRNYLVDLGPAVPTLRVAWPGLEPLSSDNQDCFTPRARSRQYPKCSYFELRLDGKGLGVRQYFANALRVPHTKAEPSTSFEINHIGPNGQDGTDIYWKDSSAIPTFFQCSASVCDDWIELSDGNVVKVFFHSSQIDEILKFEAQVRSLFDRFREEATK